MGTMRVAVFNEHGGGDIYVVNEDLFETKDNDKEWVEDNGILVGSFDAHV
jgi:hypothetical protein